MKMYLEKKGKFINRDVEEGYDTHLDDSTWQEVRLPHDWAVEGAFDKHNSSGTGYLPGGIGWYRIPFEAPAEAKDCELSLCFQGVYKRCKVWLNNYYLGSWANGYTAFSFDVTHAVRFDRENLLAVRIEHEDLADSRWYTGSGIERPVALEYVPKLHITERELIWKPVVDTGHPENTYGDLSVLLEDHRACGENISAPGITEGGAEDPSVQNVKIEILLDGVKKGELKENATPGETYVLHAKICPDQVRLWSPESPELYDLTLRLTGEDGSLLQEITRRVGFVQTKFDPDLGFFCNGQNVTLKGVCLHEDAGSFGNAVPENVWKRRLLKLRAMGCNTIRMSHNPHEEVLYRLCDELGFFVIDEIFDEWEGPKNKWWQGHNVYPPKKQGYYLDYPAWHEKDVESFVKEGRKHISVILWSIGNEIDYPNDPYAHESFDTMTGNNDAGKPKEERMYDPERPNAIRLVKLARDLTELVKRFDTIRPVSLASAFPELSSHTGLFDCLDVIGYNYKEQFYEEDHRRFPKQPIFGSENGHDYGAWRAVTDHPYIAGQCLWTGIDYLGETHGWPEHGSKAGHMTTAAWEKPDYYFRQSLWTKKPMVKLATWIPGKWNWMEFREFRWDYEPGRVVTVEAYSNMEKVELFLNGKSLGIRERDTEGKFTWEVVYEPGELTARVPGESEVSDTLYTTGLPCRIRLIDVDRAMGNTEFKAGGCDYRQIKVQLLDAANRICNLSEEEVQVTVEGAAVLAHMDNGNLADTTSYTSPRRRAYHGELMLYLRSIEEAGACKVTVEANHMETVEMRLETV